MSRDLVKKLSAGLFTNSVDMLLFAVSLGLNLYASGSKGKDPITILEKSFKLTKIFQEKLLQSCTAYAKSRKYLERIDGELRLTREGKKRLKKQLPEYQSQRPWDNRLYLIVYDIKESQREKRYLLNRWLKEHKAVMLQKSVWVTVKNLEPDLRRENQIFSDEGMILVSSLKSGEGINGKPVKQLVEQWYHLEELNKRYDAWLGVVKANRKMDFKKTFILKMKYLKILEDDPQLPFSLLPDNWLGDKVYQVYKLISDRK